MSSDPELLDEQFYEALEKLVDQLSIQELKEKWGDNL